MLDKPAIQELQKAEAITAATKALTEALAPDFGYGSIALPDDFTLHDLEKLRPLRRRARGIMATSSVESFAAYVLQHKEPGATVFVSAATMHATAVLNLGTPTQPTHADNLAQLEAKRTAAFAALLGMHNAGRVSQTTAAEFMEDWASSIGCFDHLGETAEAIPLRQAIASIRRLTIDFAKSTDSQVSYLASSLTTMERINAKATGDSKIPTMLAFTCEPFAGFSSRQLQARISIGTSGPGEKAERPQIRLQIVNFERHVEEMAAEFVDIVKKALASDTGVPVMAGVYKVGT